MSLHIHTEGEGSEYTVGRSHKLALFSRLLQEQPPYAAILNVYGIAGIGKSSWLDTCRRLSIQAGAAVAWLDGESLSAAPHGFCTALLDALSADAGEHADKTEPLERCLSVIRDRCTNSRLVIMIDTFEKLDALDPWMREQFAQRLDHRALLVLAGRRPLSEPWFLAPSLRKRITRLPFKELSMADVEQYAAANGIEDGARIQRLWQYCKGHPLMMSLAAFLDQQSEENGNGEHYDDHDAMPFLVEQWMKEVPDAAVRAMIEAAAILRQFDQDNLSYMLREPLSSVEFHRLIRFSFVRRVQRGYTIHALMRDAVCCDLALRAPVRYAELVKRGLEHYYGQFIASEQPKADSREALELMYYMGDGLVRAFMNVFDLVPRHYEPLGSHTIGDLEQYVERRRRAARDLRIELRDPGTGQTFDLSMSAEQSCYTISSLRFEELLELDCDAIKVMTDGERGLIGFAVVIPIHRGTLPYLLKAERSRTYFASLPWEELVRLEVPETTRAGWFIETIDAEDFSDPSQQTAIGHLLHSLIFSGELVVESPAPLPYFIATHHSLGFQIAPNGTHTAYDGITPTPTFVLDLREGKLIDYIHRMMRQSGGGDLIEGTNEAEAAVDDTKEAEPDVRPAGELAGGGISGRTDITEREKEVAKLLELGLTNAEIAAKLYISEATVKKHMKSMLAKLGAVNRTQLLKKLLED